MHDWKSEFDFSVKIMELKRYSVLNPVEVTFMYIYLCTDFLIYFSYSFIYSLSISISISLTLL